MPNLPIISFNTGEATPQIDTRSDVEKYSSSCRTLENMLPLIYGSVERRPGTKYVATAKDSPNTVRMVEFIFSSEIAYMCEFGDLYIRFYFGGSPLLNGSNNVVEVTTTYLKADLPQLQFEQIGDVRWATHLDYAQRKLTRTTATSFSLDEIVFEKGPFLIRNDLENDDDVTMTITGYDIATVTTGAAGAAVLTVTFSTAALATAAALLFPANKRFYIGGSTTGATNIDGAYTIDPLRATSASTVTLTVNPSEAIASDPAANGDITVAGGTGTLTASSATFTTGSSGHAGALWKLTHPRVQVVTSGDSTGTSTGVVGQAIDVKGNFTFNAFGTWDATIELQRNEDGTNWEVFRTFIGNDNKQIDFGTSEPDDNIQYRMNVTEHSGGGTINLDLTVSDSTQDSILRIDSVTNTTTAAITFITPTPVLDATKRWAEGAWSAVQGYPKAVTSAEGRIVYGGISSGLPTIWLSAVDDYEDFEEGLNDDDSFSITPTSTNEIRWIAALDSLLMGTASDEWAISSSKVGQPLTPTNFSAKIQTRRGSKDIQAVRVNETILFVDFVGRKIRELTFTDIENKFVSPDLSALAEHITETGITSIAHQRNPDSILWCTLTDGTLLSMTYEREQNVIAWAKHLLGGTSTVVVSVAVIPGSSEDEVWVAVQRTIDSSTVTYIEQMQPRVFGNQEDAFFVDSGLTRTASTTSQDISFIGYTVRYGAGTYGEGPYGGVA